MLQSDIQMGNIIIIRMEKELNHLRLSQSNGGLNERPNTMPNL